MKANRFRKISRRRKESGQAIMLLMLVLGIVLVGAVAFAVDMGSLWYHRQAAQNAADATCTAGAMDMLVGAEGAATGHQGFTSGTSFDCKAHPTYAPCQYAAFNGYDSKNTTPGNFVQVGFPTAAQVSGVPSAAVPSTATVPNAFMRVDVVDHVPTWFSGLFSGKTTQDVRALAVCGVVLATSPVPLVVLNPTKASAMQGNGTPTVRILGGPPKSIQVDSNSGSAVGFGGTIDLSKGGPDYAGSQFGTFGGPATPTGTFLPNKSFWIYPSAPVSDPFQNVAAPTCTTACPPAVPSDLAANTTCNTSAKIQAGSCTVPYRTSPNPSHGCPDPGGCVLYTAGYYPSGIQVGPGSGTTALFDPGVYYLKGGLALQSNSMVRPSTFTPPAPNNIGGTVFYLTGNAPTCSGQKGLVCVGSNSGKRGGLDSFSITAAQCPGGAGIDPKLLAILPAGATTLTGNMLLAPCTGPYGDQLGTGQYRGILFFADRSNGAGGGWGGGGGFLLAGSMYFHQCNAAGTGVGCGAPPTDFNADFHLQGGSGSTSYILGEIVTDTLSAGGNPDVSMVLNPSKTNSILKATLLPWSSTN